MQPGHIAKSAVLSSDFLLMGVISRGICPPTLFIKNRNMAITTAFTECGTISTITVNKTANQVSAEKKMFFLPKQQFFFFESINITEKVVEQ